MRCVRMAFGSPARWASCNAAGRRLLDLATAFDALSHTNFHVRPDLLDALLAEDRANRGVS